MVTHSSGSVLLIERVDLPHIEIDLEIDSMCRSHANGIEVRVLSSMKNYACRSDYVCMYCMYVWQVPIKKGGLRVRARIALPDGSALLVAKKN